MQYKPTPQSSWAMHDSPALFPVHLKPSHFPDLHCLSTSHSSPGTLSSLVTHLAEVWEPVHLFPLGHLLAVIEVTPPY